MKKYKNWTCDCWNSPVTINGEILWLPEKPEIIDDWYVDELIDIFNKYLQNITDWLRWCKLINKK